MNEVLMQDAQNLIEDKILPIVLVTFIARLVSVSVRPINRPMLLQKNIFAFL